MTKPLLKEPNMEDMMKSITNVGGLFYQYRPCRRNTATIYDIENIRHGVVYAQTPLNMNDPFDSMFGYSAEKIYDNCISIVVNAMNATDTIKAIVTALLKYRAFGKIAELMVLLHNLKQYLLSRRSKMHETHMPLESFFIKYSGVLFEQLPKSLNINILRAYFVPFSLLVCKLGAIEITEANIISIIEMDDSLDKLQKKTEEVRDSKYLPAAKEFLSKLTVSCFSISGWNNQLMWSHYANSYTGICIEYDFTKINDFVGFIYPVEYSPCRPTLDFKDLGIIGYDTELQEFIHNDVNISAIFSYILSKNTCWSYENEWRIIDVGEPNTPKFIDLPYIKSITFGLNVDSLCKRLLWDVCEEKGIECYEIMISKEDFNLDRRQLTERDFIFNIDDEVGYVNILGQQIVNSASRVSALIAPLNNESESGPTDFSHIRPMFVEAIDILSNAYYMKASCNRICDNIDEDLSNYKMPEVILEATVQIDSFADQMKQSVESITDTLPKLLILGKLSKTDYPIIQKQVQDIKELIERYERNDWNPVYKKNDVSK